MPKIRSRSTSTGDLLLTLGIIALASGLSLIATGMGVREDVSVGVAPTSLDTQDAADDANLAPVVPSPAAKPPAPPGQAWIGKWAEPARKVTRLPNERRSYILKTAALIRYRWWNHIPSYMQPQDTTRTVAYVPSGPTANADSIRPTPSGGRALRTGQ